MGNDNLLKKKKIFINNCLTLAAILLLVFLLTYQYLSKKGQDKDENKKITTTYKLEKGIYTDSGYSMTYYSDGNLKSVKMIN